MSPGLDGEFVWMLAAGAMMGAFIGSAQTAMHGGDFLSWEGTGLGALTGLISPGIGLGVSCAMPVNATTFLEGVLQGAFSGAFSGGLSGGVSNAIMGGDFGDGFVNGLASGALTGAISGGMKSLENRNGNLHYKTGEKLTPEEIAEAKKRGIQYNNSDDLSTNNKKLVKHAKRKFLYKEKIKGIDELTTRVPEGYGLTEDHWLVSPKGSIVGGRTIPIGNFQSRIHIAAYYVESAPTWQLNGVLGHEFIHAIHVNKGLIKINDTPIFSETVAYKWQYNYYKSIGKDMAARDLLPFFNNKSHITGTYDIPKYIPSEYKISSKELFSF